MPRPGTVMTQLRAARDITQQQLAESLGVALPQVSRWERGECSPRWGRAVGYAHAIGHTIALRDSSGTIIATDLDIPAALAERAERRGHKTVADARRVVSGAVYMFCDYARSRPAVVRASTVEDYADALNCTITVHPQEENA